MARFQFQLEGVLRHRKNIERDRQRQLALLQAEMQQMQAEMQQLDGSARQATGDLCDGHLLGPLDLSYLAAHRRFVVAVRQKAIALAQRMAILQRRIDEARQTLAEAAKQRKIMEKLSEKQHQRWLEAMNRKEMEQLDEIGMQLSHRHLQQQGSDETTGGPA